MPDILYCVDYIDYTGVLIRKKRDTKPIDISSLPNVKDSGNVATEKKPVLEIITQVSTERGSYRRGPTRRYVPVPPRPRSVRSASSSRASSPNIRSSSPYVRAPPPRTRPTYYSSSDDEELEPVASKKVGKTMMVIHSPNLRNVIRNIVKYWPGSSLLVGITSRR